MLKWHLVTYIYGAASCHWVNRWCSFVWCYMYLFLNKQSTNCLLFVISVWQVGNIYYHGHKLYCTLGLRGKNFLSVSLKSHKERSSSVSPRKLLRPNVSLCHTERFRSWDFRYSILTLYCIKNKPTVLDILFFSISNTTYCCYHYHLLTLRISLYVGFKVFFFTDVFLFPRLAESGMR